MGVAGIFLDEAGYEFAAVTRERQNMAVRLIHELGLSAFMNAYFPDHLFSVEENLPYANGTGKNPKRLPSLLGDRDMFLLESFQVKNGAYEEVPAWRTRLSPALGFRKRHGSRIFATTTTTEAKPFDIEQFNYAWWTAALFGLDGFGWGAPQFAAATNVLPDRRCSLETSARRDFHSSQGVGSNDIFAWKEVGASLIVIDSRDHSVRRLPATDAVKLTNVEALIRSPQATRLLICGANR